MTGASISNEGLPPPSYDQAIKMREIFPSIVPLLDENFPESIIGTSKILKFEWDREENTSDYSFFIRDTAGCLNAKGTVVNYNTTLMNLNGIEMLKIQRKDFINSETAAYSFVLLHQNEDIGTIIFDNNAPTERCLRIQQRNTCPEIIIKSLNLGDFAVFREHLPNPICHIQMPETDVHGTIIFHPETRITVKEQLLCTAAAVVYRVSKRGIFASTRIRAIYRTRSHALIFLLLFVLVFAIGLFILDKMSCDYRQEGFSLEKYC